VDPRPARSQTPVSDNLEEVYSRRFDQSEEAGKEDIWAPIVAYLERYFADGPIVDIACDRGYFIRHVRKRERWASDIRDISDELPPDVHFVKSDGLALAEVLPTGHFGVAFMSNYLEHLSSSDAVIAQLRVARELLRPGGRVIVLQPNIRLIGGAYWDFIDHRTPLTDRSLEEAAAAAGLLTYAVVRRFLPYTTKGRLPHSSLLVRAYLALRPAWRLMGKQTLYVGERVG
jgi:SAM-dependent methyltransferase